MGNWISILCPVFYIYTTLLFAQLRSYYYLATALGTKIDYSRIYSVYHRIQHEIYTLFH